MLFLMEGMELLVEQTIAVEVAHLVEIQLMEIMEVQVLVRGERRQRAAVKELMA